MTAYTITTERARRAAFDLWHYRPQSPAGDLTQAVSYLLHFTETKAPWPKKDIDAPEAPVVFYLQVRSVLDPTRDADLCRRIDAVLEADSKKLRSLPQVLTTGPVPE